MYAVGAVVEAGRGGEREESLCGRRGQVRRSCPYWLFRRVACTHVLYCEAVTFAHLFRLASASCPSLVLPLLLLPPASSPPSSSLEKLFHRPSSLPPSDATIDRLLSLAASAVTAANRPSSLSILHHSLLSSSLRRSHLWRITSSFSPSIVGIVEGKVRGEREGRGEAALIRDRGRINQSDEWVVEAGRGQRERTDCL